MGTRAPRKNHAAKPRRSRPPAAPPATRARWHRFLTARAVRASAAEARRRAATPSPKASASTARPPRSN
eukprot:11544783-Alexandrium_andersonii.AAC.1